MPSTDCSDESCLSQGGGSAAVAAAAYSVARPSQATRKSERAILAELSTQGLNIDIPGFGSRNATRIRPRYARLEHRLPRVVFTVHH